MTRIAIELVPRNKEVLEKEWLCVKENFPKVKDINIPDILRFDIRSWDACETVQVDGANAIPHLRSIDFDLKAPERLLSILDKGNFREVLVVTGDKPQDLSHKVYKTSSIEMIRFIKKERPQIKVHAALDPYRLSLRDELNYCQRKKDAGCDAFFTQPFFDLRLMEIYADQLKGCEIFWGVSPVLSENSQRYWETRNMALFPPDFQPTLEWNRAFARKALDFVEKRGDSIYFMPIRCNIKDYLEGILNTKEELLLC